MELTDDEIKAIRGLIRQFVKKKGKAIAAILAKFGDGADVSKQEQSIGFFTKIDDKLYEELKRR